MKQKREPLRIVGEYLRNSRTEEITEGDPAKCESLVMQCKAAAMTFETGEVHYVANDKEAM